MSHFTAEELACRHCGKLRMHPGFLDELEQLREQFGRPMQVNSGCRCAEHNAAIGGHSKSLHVMDREQHAGQQGTLAIDIHCPDGGYRGQLFMLAWQRGWSIGWNGPKQFLHLDRRDFVGLPQLSFDY